MADLTQARALELFNYDPQTGSFRWRQRDESEFATTRASACWNSRFAGIEAGSKDNRGYDRVSISGRMYLKHRVIWLMVHGVWPTVIDHINGKPSDNRLENLRDVTIAENQRNIAVGKANKSGSLGVEYDDNTGLWDASIKSRGTVFFLGGYQTKYDAILARRSAERLLGFHENHGRRTA